MILTDRIYHQDCLEGMKKVPSESVDMILSDLPYACTKNEWDNMLPLPELWEAYSRIIKQNGAIVLFGSGWFTAELMLSNRKMWRYNLVWEKTTPTGFLNAKKMPLRCHEDILVFYNSLPTYNPIMTPGVRKTASAWSKRNSRHGDSYGEYKAVSYDSDMRYPRSVLHFATDKQKNALHPTQKPIALLEHLIKMYSNEGDVILDSCIGSGSTCVAAINTKRHYIGFETDEQYFNIARHRIEETEKLKELNS